MGKTYNINGIRIEILSDGKGQEVKAGDTVSIHYSGFLANGTKFDSSIDRGVPFETKIGVGHVIQGWDIGVVGMKKGEKRKLTIPSHFGYGPQGVRDIIPPNADLIFDVELLDIISNFKPKNLTKSNL